jgi:DNA-binding winged helix-turn-helix (wHTH) protein
MTVIFAEITLSEQHYSVRVGFLFEWFMVRLITLILCVCWTQVFASDEQSADALAAYVDDQIRWISGETDEIDTTDIRIKVASSTQVLALGLWDDTRELLFPDIDASQYFDDHAFNRNLHRWEGLLNAPLASPGSIVWELNDMAGDSLLYCKKGSPVSACALLDTDELAESIGISKQALLASIKTDTEGVHRPSFADLSLYTGHILALIFLTSMVIIFHRVRIKQGAISATGDQLIQPGESIYVMGDMTINARQLMAEREGLTVNLTSRDIKLLMHFCERPNEVISKDELYNVGWGRDFVQSSRALEQHILNLRRKLDPGRNRPALIETVHGQGYRFPAIAER